MKKPRAAKTDEKQNKYEAMMELMLKDLLTAKEAAALLGTNASRVRQLVGEKKLIAVKKGNLLIVHRQSVLNYLNERRRRGRPPTRT